jgi:hypothetical protein
MKMLKRRRRLSQCFCVGVIAVRERAYPLNWTGCGTPGAGQKSD